MVKKPFKVILFLFMLTITFYCIYKFYPADIKPLEVSQYKQFRIIFDYPIVFDNTTKENIIIKDKDGNSVDSYVFLSTDEKSIIINPPIDGYSLNENYSITVSPKIHFENFELKNKKVVRFKVTKDVRQAPVKVKRKAQIGDIVGVSGEFMGYKYDHYGLYLGNNKVIHYWSNTGKAEDTEIMETDMNKYFVDGKYFVLDLKDYSKFNAEETIKRSKERLGEKNYDLLQNNCEDFVIWCKTDDSKSFQVANVPKDQIQVIREFMSLGLSLQ
jgi:hypothetical protein